MRLNDFRLSTRITAGMLLLVAVGALVWIGNENRHLHEVYLVERGADIEAAIHVEQLRLSQDIEALRQDALFLAATQPVAGIVRATTDRGPRDPIPYEHWVARLQETYVAFLRARPNYFKVRLIGLADGGRELVRVERRDGQVAVTPRDALQAKGGRDYFKAGTRLASGEVYLSEFTLNQERGKIEVPYRPTLRAVTPVFDAQGRMFGMVVISQDVHALFDFAQAGLPPGVQAFIADREGHYLLHPEPGHAFSFELGSRENVADDFPALKPLVAARGRAHLPLQEDMEREGEQYLAAARIYFDVGDPARFLVLAYHIPASLVAEQVAGLARSRSLDVLLTMMLIGSVLFLMLHRAFSPLRRITDAARAIAAGDRKMRLSENSKGEIAELSSALNGMLDKLSDGELIEQENAFRKELIESLPGVFYMIDVQGRFLMWNHNLEQVLRRSAEEIASGHPLDFFEGQDKARIGDAMHQVFGQGEVSVEAVLVAKDGTKTSYHFTGRRVQRDGEPVLVGMGLDITQRKLNEEAMRVAAAAFETQDAILITDAQANIIRVNRAFTRITGYTAEEVMGQNPKIMSSGRHDQAFYAEMWQQIREVGGWAGEIWDRRKGGEVYPKWLTITAVKNELDVTTQYVAIFSDITARKQAEEEIRNLAFYDALTQLPNRRFFQERFRAALAASARHADFGAILFIDLDRFKLLNDTQGHDYGDLLLVEVAARIRHSVREVDTVSRLGGDEFVVLLEGISSDKADATHKVERVAEKIRSALSAPYRLMDHEHHSSPSIGITLYHGNEESMDVLLKHADAAMYQAKNAGRNTVCFYEALGTTNLENRE